MTNRFSIKILAFLLFILLSLQLAAAQVPNSIQNYCSGFDMEECDTHSQWFFPDDCKVQIRCVAEVDFLSLFRFKGCRTALRFDITDCENSPSVLCFNNIAYDISQSRTCSSGGVQFRKIDSCGNVLNWGRCIDMESCTTVMKTPHTGTAIPVQENCQYLDEEPQQKQEVQEEPADDREDDDSDRRDDDAQRREYNEEIQIQQKTVEQVIQDTDSTAEAQTDTKEEVVLISASGNRRIIVNRPEEGIEPAIILLLAGYTAAMLVIITLGILLYRKRMK